MILNKIRSQYIYIFIYFNKIDEKYIKKHKKKKRQHAWPFMPDPFKNIQAHRPTWPF
jgi:hypothetical protein